MSREIDGASQSGLWYSWSPTPLVVQNPAETQDSVVGKISEMQVLMLGK